MLEQDNISRIKILLKAHPRGLTITDVSSNLKMNRNSAAKYLEILQIAGLVESKSYGTARVFFLTHRLPISALVSITDDLVITLNENHHILFVNESFCTFFAVKKEDVTGNHILEIFKTAIGGTGLPGVFSDIIAGKEGVQEVRFSGESGYVYLKIKSMKTVFDDGSRGITIIIEDVTRESRDKIELEAKEARYRAIVEDQIEYVTRFLPDGTLSFVNSAFFRHLEKKPENLIGTPFSDTILDQDRPVFERSLQSLNHDNPVVSFECRITRRDKPVHWCSWTLRALFDHRKDPVEFQAVGHDVTSKKEEADRISRELTQMEFFSSKLQQFVELPPDQDIYKVISAGFFEILPVAAICVSSYDPTTSTLMIKAVCPKHDQEVFTKKIGRDIIGVKIPAGEGGPSLDLLSGRIFCRKGNLFDITRGELAEPICAGIEESLDLGEYFSAGMVWRGTLLGTVTFSIRKGGLMENVTLAETYLRAASIALQRTRAESALKESERLYRSVLENFQDVYYRADMEGNLIMASPSALDMFGYQTLADLPNKNIGRDFYLDPKKRTDFINAITPTGSVRNFEAVLKKQDGTPVYTEISSHFVYDSNGVPVGMEGILRDISERKEASKKIQQHIGEMEFLSQKLLDFLTMEPSDNIFKKILSDLKTLVPDSTILVNSFNKLTGMVTVQCYEASEQRREAIFRALGRDLAGCEFPIDSDGLAAFQTGQLTKGDIPLFEVAFKSIPKPICDRLESELEITGKYAIGFVRRGEIMGNAAIFLAGERAIPNQRIVEMYAREAAIALQRYLAEEEQRRSDEIFENIIRYSPLPIALINADDTFDFINESQKHLFGYTLNDFHTVQEWLGLILPDPAEFEKASASWLSHKSKYRAGDSFSTSYTVHCRDGTTRNTIVRIVFLSSEKICVISEDMTDRIRAEQTNRLLSSIIQNTDDAVIAKDTRGTIISWNRAAERLYGYSAAEATGQDIALVIPADKTEETKEILNRIDRGESVNNLETRRIRKDGRFVEVSLTVSPIMDDAGKIIGASTIARDITRHKAEERLHENEEQYRSLMENISVGFYRSTGDPTGRFIWGNSSLVHTLGYTSFEQLSGIGIADIFVEQDGRKKLLDDLKKEHVVRNREIALHRADGKTVTVIVNAFARFDQDGNLSCISGIVEDISGQKQAEDQVQILDQQIEDILASIPDAVVITDQKNRVLAWNIAMEKVTGVEKASIAGRDEYERLFPFYDPSRPSLVTLFDAADGDLERYYPGAYRDGATLVAQVRPLQNRKDLPGYFIHRVSPLSDLQGQRIGAVQIIRPPAPDGRNSTRQLR